MVLDPLNASSIFPFLLGILLARPFGVLSVLKIRMCMKVFNSLMLSDQNIVIGTSDRFCDGWFLKSLLNEWLCT